MPSSPSPELRTLQRTLYDVLTDPRGARAGVAARPQALAWIQEAPPLDRPTRLSVYGDGYFLRLLDCLSADYPALRRALGERDFRALAAEYGTRHPPASSSLADFGDSLPAFLTGHRFSRRWPFLADLARLERAVLVALLTDRLPPLDPSVVARLRPEAWGRSRLVFDPTARLLRSKWPLARLWRSRDKPADAPGWRLRRERVGRLLVWRAPSWVRVRELPYAEGVLLERALAGYSLAAIVSAEPSTRPAAVRRWFSRWMRDGLIKGIAPA